MSIIKIHFMGGFTPNGIEKSFLVNPIHKIFYSRPCKSGEKQTLEETCEECRYTFYLIEPPTKPTKCLICPENAECFGSNKITPKKGSYRSSLESPVTLHCLNPKACLGGSLDNLEGTCAEGYHGLLCGACDSKK